MFLQVCGLRSLLFVAERGVFAGLRSQIDNVWFYLCADGGVLGVRKGRKKGCRRIAVETGGFRSSIVVDRRGVFADLRLHIVDLCRQAQRFRRSEA